MSYRYLISISYIEFAKYFHTMSYPGKKQSPNPRWSVVELRPDNGGRQTNNTPSRRASTGCLSNSPAVDSRTKSIRFNATVNVRLTFEVPVQIKNPYGCTVSYRFTTTPSDISFGLYFRDVDGNESTLKENDRVPSHIGAANGTIHPSYEGVIYFRWDNSYNWLTVKELTYLIEVISSIEPIGLPVPDVMERTPLKPTKAPQLDSPPPHIVMLETQLKREVEALQKQITLLKIESAKDKDEMAMKDAEIATLREQLASEGSKLADIVNENSQLKHDLQHAQSIIQRLDDDQSAEDYQKSAAEAAAALNAATTDAALAQSRYDTEIRTLRATNDALLSKVNLLSSKLKSVQEFPTPPRPPPPVPASTPKSQPLEHYVNVPIISPHIPVVTANLTPLANGGSRSHMLSVGPGLSTEHRRSLQSTLTPPVANQRTTSPSTTPDMHPLLVPVNAMLYGITFGNVNAWEGSERDGVAAVNETGAMRQSDTARAPSPTPIPAPALQEQELRDRELRQLQILKAVKPPRPDGARENDTAIKPLLSILKNPAITTSTVSGSSSAVTKSAPTSTVSGSASEGEGGLSSVASSPATPGRPKQPKSTNPTGFLGVFSQL